MAARGAKPGIAGDFDAAVADMQRESARMGRLLENLLLLARSDAPEGAPHHPRPVRLDLLAHDAVRGGAALATGQRLEVVTPDEVTIEGDPDRLLQLLLILLENAIRHTPAGASIALEVQPPHDGLVRLIVRDEGEGIAPEHLPHLFDRFYRADGARGRATGGTGLGLAIARTIVRSHGGEIAVASAPGKGTTFTVTLPSAPSGDARVPQPTALSAPRVL
jgi:two-component system OmpR family sensor kinase